MMPFKYHNPEIFWGCHKECARISNRFLPPFWSRQSRSLPSINRAWFQASGREGKKWSSWTDNDGQRSDDPLSIN